MGRFRFNFEEDYRVDQHGNEEPKCPSTNGQTQSSQRRKEKACGESHDYAKYNDCPESIRLIGLGGRPDAEKEEASSQKPSPEPHLNLVRPILIY